MRKLVKASSILTGVSIGEMLVRFVRTKFIAIILGTAGTGLLAQLTLFFEVLRVWGDLGSRRAVIKQVAESNIQGKNSEAYRQIIQTSYVLALIFSFAITAFVCLFSRFISRSLFGTDIYYPYVIGVAAILPVASVSTITGAIVKGNLDYASFAVYTMFSYLGVILCTPILIHYYQIWGSIAALALFFIFPFIGYLVYNCKERFLYFTKNISVHALKEQFSHGFLQIYANTLSQITRLMVSAWIVKEMGLHYMGIYQVVITFSTIYLLIPIQAMTGYTFPVVAAAKTEAQISKAINESLRFLVFALAPVIVALFIWPESFIRLFYSKEFLESSAILRVQLLSAVFIVVSYAYNSALIARTKLKSLFVVATASPAVHLIFSYLLFPKWKLMGLAAALSLAAYISMHIQYVAVKKEFNYQTEPKNIRLLWATAIWMLASAVLMIFHDTIATKIISFSLILPWVWFSTKDHERHFFAQFIMGVIFKRPKVNT